MHKEDKHFYGKFENNICLRGERYSVKLTFAESFSQLPDNLSNFFTCLKNLKVKFQNNDKLKDNYSRVSNEYESSEVIEKFGHNETVEPGVLHYLPQRDIVKNNKKEISKIKIVSKKLKYYPLMNFYSLSLAF